MIADDCPRFLLPRLRLFLSADIVGSTALKQSVGRQSDGFLGNRWFSAIQGFYIEANRSFAAEWHAAVKTAGTDFAAGAPPEMWKTVGDEVLFIKDLTSYRQVALALTAWKSALSDMREFIKGQDSRLDVKCTAWIAGFPLKNKEVVLRGIQDPVDDYFLASGRALNRFYEEGAEKSDVAVDFIGPSIDIGFRLATLSSIRRFTISVDVAYIVALTMPYPGYPAGTLKLFYQGPAQLKGVLGGVDYPHFWIDTGDGELPALEDNLSGARITDRDAVVNYCEEFYRHHSEYVFRPFISSEHEQHISDRPEWYDDAHKVW